MKLYITSVLTVLMTVLLFLGSSTTASAQCPNDNSLWLDLTPTFLGHINTTTCTFGGEYCTANVTAGITYRFSTCGDPDFDTEITLYNNTGGAFIAYNDDAAGCSPQSEIIWTATFTGTVRILVDEAPTCAARSTCMTLAVEWMAAPPTSECTNAAPAACGATVTGSTVGDSPQTFGTCTTTAGTGGAHWYTFVGDGNVWSAETVATAGQYDTKIWVFTGTCAALTCVTGNDDGGAGTLSLVSFPTVSGQTYWIVVGGFSSSEGNYAMDINNDMGCVAGCTPPAAPVVTDDNLCSPGAANLTATPSMGGTIEWYDGLGTFLGTGTTYSPVVGTTTSYYAAENIGTGGAPTSITTLWANNNGQSGIMFDVSAINALTVNSFEINAGSTADYEIYTKAGTHVGSEMTAGAWTLVGSATGVVNSPAGTATVLPIPVNVAVAAGQTQSFYVTASTGTGMLYTNGTAVGNIYSSDANIQVKEGTGKAYPFSTNYAPRILNGVVHYTPGNSCTSPQSTATATVSAAPTAPTTVGDNICMGDNGSTVATSTSGEPSPVLAWYTAATGGTFLGNGTTYNTPPLNMNTTYYVEEIGGAGGGPSALSTQWNHNNGQSGIMFDITATADVTINDFETNVDLLGDWELYTKTGTHVGSEMTAGAWTLVGSATNVPNNPAGTATPIPIVANVAILTGNTQAFYLTYSSGTGMNYTDGVAVGTVHASDANIQVKSGTGKAYPFGTNYKTRIFNGVVNYTVSGGCGPSPRTPVQVDVRQTQYAVINNTTSTNTTCTVTEGGVDWTYYYDSANPDDLLFAIAHDPAGLGNNTFTANVDITVANNPTTTGYYWAEDLFYNAARFAMGRYWNVNITSGALVDPVWVRFYYDPAEKAAIMAAATAWQGTYGSNLSTYVHFKTVGSSYDPAVDLYPGGVYGSIDLNPNTTDNLTTLNGVNYVEYQGVTSFSGGSIVVGVTPLPPTASEVLLNVKLESFDVEKYQEEDAIVKWTTLDETDVVSFIVEHSLDGVNFSEIGQASPKAVTGQLETYSFLHENPQNGTNYYRLRVVNADGSFDYSIIKALTFGDATTTFNVKPNPFVDQFTVQISSAIADDVEMTIYNSLGMIVHQKDVKVQKGNNELTVGENIEWSPGTYIVQLKSGLFSAQRKIIKK